MSTRARQTHEFIIPRRPAPARRIPAPADAPFIECFTVKPSEGGKDKSKTRINLSGAKILVIQPPRSDVLTAILNGFGVSNIASCGSAAEAAKQMRDTDFDLAICDAGQSGDEVLDFIVSLRRDGSEPNRYCSIILLQGHTPATQIEKARDCGANIVVVKPLRPAVLLDRIIWVATVKRNFLETSAYVGPDRRFQNLGAPNGGAGRRKTDAEDLTVSEEGGANMSQVDLDKLVMPTKVKI